MKFQKKFKIITDEIKNSISNLDEENYVKMEFLY